jgi:uncharacterized repeat protein (TIGR03803 family)
MKSRSVRPSLTNGLACSFPAEEAKVCPKSCHWRKIVLGKMSLMKRSATLVFLVSGVLLGAAYAQTETVLYSFCAPQANCADGERPEAGLIFDLKGNLYGTTYSGGDHDYCGNNRGAGCGVVFKLTPEGKETVLYSFCAQTNCTDGAGPAAGLIFDQRGNLYGTTDAGGAYGYGVVFKLTPKGKETVLYSFCAQGGYSCTDGANPYFGAVLDQKGNLYGTTYGGGAYDSGVVFKLTPEGKETVLYSFCAQTNCTDGENPAGGLVFDHEGNLYGTTLSGGAHTPGTFGGVVFKLSPKGKETVLYSFCAQSNCADGAQPYAAPIFDRKGNLYGTTYFGGANVGVVFKLTPNGEETVLHTFCTQNNCTDGAYPYAGLLFDQKGNLYGTTSAGGAPRYAGVVFKLTPEGEETVLYSFCWHINCTDGAAPLTGLVLDRKGNLYGTTVSGGASEYEGVVFKLSP